MSPGYSINHRFPQGSFRQQNQRSHAVRPVTIRQLVQTVIRERPTRIGTEFRYSLNGHDFRIVNLVLPPVGNVSGGIYLALTGHIRRKHRRGCAFGRENSDLPHRGWNWKDNIDVYDRERRRGERPTKVGVTVPPSSEVRRVRC